MKIQKSDYWENKSETEQNQILERINPFVLDVYNGKEILLSEKGNENFQEFLGIIEDNDDEKLLPFYAYVLNLCLDEKIKVYTSIDKKSYGAKENYFGGTLYRQFLKYPDFYFYYKLYTDMDLYNNYSDALIVAFSPVNYKWDDTCTTSFYEFRNHLVDKIDRSMHKEADKYFGDFILNVELYANAD